MNLEQISNFEKAEAQLESIYIEISNIAQREPDSELSKFTIEIIKEVLEIANKIFGKEAQPLKKVSLYEREKFATASDALIVLSQYVYRFDQIRVENTLPHEDPKYPGLFWYINGKYIPRKARIPKMFK